MEVAKVRNSVSRAQVPASTQPPGFRKTGQHRPLKGKRWLNKWINLHLIGVQITGTSNHSNEQLL